MPPPVTRSSSARPVARRAILSSPACVSVSSAMTRPLEDLLIPEPGMGVLSASSTMLFHSPQEAHLPIQRDATAPQFWQTKLLRAVLAKRSGLRFLVDAIDARAEARKQLVADGARAVGQVVDRDAIAHHLHPGAATGQLRRHLGDVDRDEVHRYAANDRHRIVADEADRAGLARCHAQGAQKAVGVADRNGGDA